MANKHNNNSNPNPQEPIDGPSHLGQFGWEKIHENFGVPVIVRSSSTRYSPVRIVEQEVIKKYDVLPQTIFQCITLRSFYLTAAETKLLNNINFNHCEGRYGEAFFTTKDVIISAQDVKDLYRFLEVSRKIFNGEHEELLNKCGIITVTIDPQNTAKKVDIPYICKYKENTLYKFVPASLFGSYVITTRSKAVATEWDLMYLKMLCIYCNPNFMQLLQGRDILIIQLDGMCHEGTSQYVKYERYLPPTNNYNHIG